MPIYTRDDVTRNIVNGLVTVGGQRPTTYDPPQVQHIGTGETISQFTALDARYLAEKWRVGVDPVVPGDTSAAAAGGDALIYLPASGNRRHVLFGLGFSYASTPVSGFVSVQSPSGTLVFKETVTAAGPNSFLFDKGLKAARGGDVLISLNDGNAAKTLSLLGKRDE